MGIRNHTAGIRRMRFALGLALGGLCLAGCNDSPTAPVTDPNAEIAILSPKGGERFAIGDSLRISWKVQGKGLYEIDAVNIEPSPDSGKTWVPLLNKSIGVADPAWGKFAWKIESEIPVKGAPYVLSGDDQAFLRIMQYSTGDPNKIAKTAKPFTLAAD